jgi:glycosyltransferase involved in cell wall biosynthesis
VYQKARSLNANIYHFHDPELIPVGLLLRAQGKQVIYDIHEDVPRHIFSKAYLPIYARLPLSWTMEGIEHITCRFFSALVVTRDAVAERLKSVNPSIRTIYNYVMGNELQTDDSVRWKDRTNSVVYVGGMTEVRSAVEMVEAMEYVAAELHATLDIAGNFFNQQLRERVMRLPGWKYANEHGILSRSEVARLLGTVRAGLVLLYPEPNHQEVRCNNKIFEYMSVGIPVIGPDIPQWRDFIKENGCGVTVNPKDAHALARAITFLLMQPQAAEEMGRRGREAIEKWYNWKTEAAKLMQLYEQLLATPNTYNVR